MERFFLLVIIVALLAAYVLILLRKLGVMEWGQIHGNKIIAELCSCDFCQSWWAGVIVAILATLFTGDFTCMLIPFCSTPITRYLL